MAPDLESGWAPPDAVEHFFRSALALYFMAPWIDDYLIVRVDIPAFGLEGGCLVMVGDQAEPLPEFVLLPPCEDHERFFECVDAFYDDIDWEALGTEGLVLRFDTGSASSPGMREELPPGWPAGARGYPVLEHRDIDGMPRPLNERDVRLGAVLASALAGLFQGHRREFEDGLEHPPVRKTYSTGSGPEVRFTFPHEKWEREL